GSWLAGHGRPCGLALQKFDDECALLRIRLAVGHGGSRAGFLGILDPAIERCRVPDPIAAAQRIRVAEVGARPDGTPVDPIKVRSLASGFGSAHRMASAATIDELLARDFEIHRMGPRTGDDAAQEPG